MAARRATFRLCSQIPDSMIPSVMSIISGQIKAYWTDSLTPRSVRGSFLIDQFGRCELT